MSEGHNWRECFWRLHLTDYDTKDTSFNDIGETGSYYIEKNIFCSAIRCPLAVLSENSVNDILSWCTDSFTCNYELILNIKCIYWHILAKYIQYVLCMSMYFRGASIYFSMTNSLSNRARKIFKNLTRACAPLLALVWPVNY